MWYFCAHVFELGASGGQRNRKRLNVNENNRSERAEQENISLKSVVESSKQVSKL